MRLGLTVGRPVMGHTVRFPLPIAGRPYNIRQFTTVRLFAYYGASAYVILVLSSGAWLLL